jgi:hypothetical protein
MVFIKQMDLQDCLNSTKNEILDSEIKTKYGSIGLKTFLFNPIEMESNSFLFCCLKMI